MSRLGLARLWATLGTLLAVYSVGTWIVVQGGKTFAELPGLEERSPVTSAYQAILIVGTLLGVLSAVGLFYFRTPRPAGDTLFPIVFVADAGSHDRRGWSLRLYQAFFLAVFLVLPAASLVQLTSAVLQRGILWHDGDPALGSIVVKNAFAWTQGISSDDEEEGLCRSTVTRDGGFTWLANMRCDPVKAARLRPFEKNGVSIEDDAKTAEASCVKALALRNAQKCEGVRDISEECEKSERHCRGMQWLPILSPTLMITTTVFGAIMMAWLLVEAASRWCVDRARKSTCLKVRAGRRQ